MLRKRRSLIASGGPASPNEPGAEPADASPGATPEPAEPRAAEGEAAPEAPFAAEPAAPPAETFGGEPSDPFGGDGGVADPFGDAPPSDPFGGFDEIRAEVKESANPAGRHYTDHGSSTTRNDTTDSGWGGGAFGGGHSEESALPSGWGTPAPAPSRSSSLGSQKPIRSAFGEDEPPTEELPSATFDDRAPAMGAPMNVPEPPPIPGLFDRFTPAPPVARGAGKSFGAAPAGAAEPIRPRFEPTAAPTRPSYLDEEPGAVKPEQSKPLPRAPAKPKDDDEDDDEAAPSGGIPFPLILGGAAVVIGMALMVLALVVVQMMGPGDPAPAQAPIAVPVPVARTVIVPPPPVPAAADTDAPSMMEETTGTTAPTTTAPATAATEPTKTPPTTTTPKVTKPKTTATTTTTPKASGATGTLKIRSNRRVLIKVNGKPRDYSPLDLPIAPGTYTVSAALAGKPESEQTVTVTLQSSAIEPVNFTF